jgi:predicted ribosome quality control (RQC) complex YloA/Tae2 family protein
MNYDALTVGAVCDELRRTVLGGRVQHVHLPDEHGLAMEIYAQGKGHWLYASAHPQRSRLHLVSARPPRASDDVTPLLLLLRKYVDGGRLDAIEQPPLERIVHLHFGKRGPAGEPWRTSLVVEVLGRQSNLILIDADDTVIDATRRVGPQQSRSRLVMPQVRYDPPPAQPRLDPRRVRGFELAAAGAAFPADRRLRDVLVASLQACSPLLAREVVYRVQGSVDAPVAGADWDALAAAVVDIWTAAGEDRWAATVALSGERLTAYAPYPLRSFPDPQPVASISRAVERWYGQTAAAVDSLQARKAPFRQALEQVRDRLRGKRYSLEQGLVSAADVATLRRAGEHLLAFGVDLAPGQERFRLPDDETDLPIDPQVDAVENARRYFARYAKAKAAAAEVPRLLTATEHELRYLDEAMIHLELATALEEINTLRAEWAELGYLKGGGRTPPNGPARGTSGGRGRPGEAGKRREKQRGQQRGRGRPATTFRRLVVGDFDVLVGRSGKGNDALLSREGHPADIWLHARGVPGSHVLIRSAGRPVPDEVLRHAAALAAGQSQARTSPSVAVDYTQRKYVNRISGAPPGLVTYRGERTIDVTPASANGPLDLST